MAKTAQNAATQKVDFDGLHARREALDNVSRERIESALNASRAARQAYEAKPSIKLYRRMVTALNRAR